MYFARVILFICFALFATAYAFTRGGRPERAIAAIDWIGFLATWAVVSPLSRRFHGAEIGVAVVDTACLVAMAWVAIRNDRSWTLWVAAMQLVVVLSHLAMWLKPVHIPHYYKNSVQLWIYPQLALLALGTLRHRLAHDPSRIERWIGSVARRLSPVRGGSDEQGTALRRGPPQARD
jgi:hypothetical protein